MLSVPDVAAILAAVAADLKGHAEELRELDSVIGDGDLGITIELGGKVLAESTQAASDATVGMLLARCGLSINKASPSTFGTLLASAFLAAGSAVREKTAIDAADLVQMGRAAVEGIKKRGKAEVGDKTMLDALVPAVEAFQRRLAEAGPAPALEAAVAAARAGMEATIDMTAKHGRASRHQQGKANVRDGGAMAMYYLIESFARHSVMYLNRSNGSP